MSNYTTFLADAPSRTNDWSFSVATQSILFSLIFPLVSLIIMSFPHYFDRWMAVTMVLTSGYAAFVTSDDLSPDDTLNEVYKRYILIGGSYMLSMAYRLDSSKKEQIHLEYKTADPTWSPWYKGYKLMWNIRGVGTPWENPYLWPAIKYTWDAPKSSEDLRKTGSTGSRHNLTARVRWSGVAIRLCYVVVNFFLLACLYEFSSDVLLNTSPSDYDPEKESIVRRVFQMYLGRRTITPVTRREILIRAASAAEYVTGNFLLFSLYHDVCAIFFIAVGLDESWEWPPFFGQITEAYSMRRWWSMWWHRSIYRSFNSHSELLLKPFGLNKKSTLYRTLTAFIIFGLSAVMHSLVTWHGRHGNPCAWGRTMIYWLLHPVAFILEGVVQGMWVECRRRMGLISSGALDVIERAVGYAWVCAFLLWIEPKNNSPLRNCVAASEGFL